MIDVKKLITGFLILAAAASLSAVVLVNINWQPASQTIQTPQITAADNTQTEPANAFLTEPSYATTSPDISAITVNSTAADQSSSDPNNLTDQLANAFINGVASANPNGPQTDDSGDQTLTQPDPNSIAMAVANATATQALQTPDWDYEADAQPIKVETSASPAAIAQYSAALSDIVNQHFVSTNLVNIVNNANPDPTQVGYVESQIQGALGDTLALQVPQPLVAFQKSMVTMMVYEKNEMEVVEDANADPLKASLILQNEDDNYQAALQNLQTQIQAASSINGFSFGVMPQKTESTGMAFVDKMLGIQTANAQWLTFDSANFGEWLLSFAKDVALQILKNALIAEIQQHVLSWVQGSGAPRFITQWGTTLINAYEQSAINAINSQFSCLNSSLSPQINLTLSTFYNANANNFCANSFQAALGGYNIQQFYNNFSNGGWLAFGASSMPTNDYYGGLYFKAQIVGQNAQNSQQATLAKITSSQGLNGDQACDDGSNPNGTHLECIDSNDVPYHPNPNGTCPAGLTPVSAPNNGTCSDGTEPQVTTPGVFTGFGVNSAIDSSPKLITAANDIAGLLNSLLTSLLNSLATTAINAGTKGILGLNPSNIQGGGTPPQPLPLMCTPSSQTASTTVSVAIGATGGKNDAQGNPPVYSWFSTDGATSSDYVFSHAFSFPGVYTVTLTDNTGDSPASCRVTVQ